MLRQNNKIWDEWRALPVVLEKEFKDLVGYGNYSGTHEGRLLWSTMPGLVVNFELVLISTSPVAIEYQPVEGMEEILESEYIGLKSKAA